MYSITSPSLILLLIVSTPYVVLYETTPLITVTHGVIKDGNSSQVSIFWYYPRELFTEGNLQITYLLNNGSESWGYFPIASYTGFRQLSSSALVHNRDEDEYCALMKNIEGIPIISSCDSKIQWMYDRREILSSFSLRDLIIPGTHESAAYTNSDKESLSKQVLISRWIHSQTTSIKAQLMDGIRYLDLRPSLTVLDNRKVYFTVSAGINLVPMEDIVKQIEEFMDLSKDIVIVFFRDFEGFRSKEDHFDFMAYLEFSFQNHIHARENWTYTLGQFWDENRRLILSYDHDVYKSSSYMWPPIPQYRNFVQTINQLHSHLDALYQNYASDVTPSAAIVGFSHSTTEIIQNIHDDTMSSRHWAERLSSHIPSWYAEKWYSAANIIAVDYYETSGIIDIAIQLNEKRAEGRKKLLITSPIETKDMPKHIFNKCKP